MEPLRNLLLAGLGAVSYSQEKLRSSISSLVEKGDLTRDQGETVLAEWVKRGETEKDQLSEKVGSEMNKILSKLSLVTSDELEELRARVEKLEERLSD